MTRRLLARIPPEKLGFSPGGGLHTLGWNASHLAEIVGWVEGTLNKPGLDIGEVDFEQAAAMEHDLPAILARFDANLDCSLAALRAADDAKLAEPWTMSMNGTPLFTMSKHDCLRKWVFTHTAHHRGIVSVMLRLAGVAHTSIYEE